MSLREDYLKAETQRDILIAKAFRETTHSLKNGACVEEAHFHENGINLKIGFSVMGCYDCEYVNVSWEDLGL